RKASELRRKLLGGPSALLVDPLGFDAGDSNLYRYVKNEPNSLTDPTGKIPVGLPRVSIDQELKFENLRSKSSCTPSLRRPAPCRPRAALSAAITLLRIIETDWTILTMRFTFGSAAAMPRRTSTLIRIQLSCRMNCVKPFPIHKRSPVQTT